MNTENHDTEWLSALADDELHGGELQRRLDSLMRDDGLRRRWANYHAIREALHGDSQLALGSQLQQRVSAALSNEPVVLAPRRLPRNWVRHVAGLAVAASVTGVAIVGVQALNQPASLPAAVPILASQAPAVQAVAQAERLPNPLGQQVRNDHLAPYLVNHNEYSSSTNMQGMLPYVRIVSHGPNQ
ncbi:MAG: sigma-E factor negative regulatory protein [Thiohalomonadaceae bacterium]